MSSTPLLVLLTVLLGFCSAKNVHARPKRSNECFGELGCFSNDPPFLSLYRPLSLLPQSPQQIHPTFTLFTRQAPRVGHTLHAGNTSGLATSTFSASRPTKFIVHGFIDNGGSDWMAEMKDEFLRHDDYNVILIDWGYGSLSLYGQASANTRVVGAMTAQLIQFLQSQADARPEDMHIIGHSLGSHVAGYAGERLRYLGRITGLDPAEPYFQGTDKVVRLDPTDALFVDVIHTDGASFYSTDLGLGMGVPCGHVDYFPNGGHDQPGCDADPVTHFIHEGVVTGTKEFVACNHLRSYHFFTESINSECPFEGYRCDSEDDFNSGSCVPCSGQGCGYMGLRADQAKPAAGTDHVKYYLKTGSSGPYCRYHYKITITIADSHTNSHSERGQLYVHLTGSTGQTQEIQVTDQAVYFAPGLTYTYLLTSPNNLGDVTNVAYRWVHDSHLLDVGSWNLLGFRHPMLYVDKIQIANGESHRTYSFCQHGLGVETDHAQVYSTAC